MSWNTRYSNEQKVARDALIASTASVTPVLSQFSNWLMGALGAAFALFITNLDSILNFVSPYSFRWSLIWFSISLLSGLIAGWLSVGVISGLTTHARIEQQMKESPPGELNFLAFNQFYSSGLIWVYKCIAWRSYKAVKSGDLLVGVKFIAKLSQWQAVLALLQIVFAAISLIILAHGIKA